MKEVGMPIGFAVLSVPRIFELVTKAEFSKHFHQNLSGWSPQQVCREFLKEHPFPYFPRRSHATYTALQDDFDINKLQPLIIEFNGDDCILRDGNHRAFFFFLLHLDNRLCDPYPDKIKVILTSKSGQKINDSKTIYEIQLEMYRKIGKWPQLFEHCWVVI